jgi:hypothetical protein
MKQRSKTFPFGALPVNFKLVKEHAKIGRFSTVGTTNPKPFRLWAMSSRL